MPPFLTPKSLAAVIETAVSTSSSLLGRTTHAQIIKTLNTQIPNFLYNHLINMYSKLDLPSSAQLVLSLTPSRSVVTWTALIAGSVQNGHFTLALLQFIDMRREFLQPNDFTFPCVLKASGSLRSSMSGKQIHGLGLKCGYVYDVFVGCSVFDMYCKTGLKHDAFKMFDEMPVRNIATWNAYISNAVVDGRGFNAIDAFIKFRYEGLEGNSITFCACLNACADLALLRLGCQLHGFVIRIGFDSDVKVSNGLIHFYGKCKDVNSSEMVFNTICDRNEVSWCSLVGTYVHNDEEEKACALFLQTRKENMKPTDFMVSSVLSACGSLSGLELGRSVHAIAVKACIENNIFVGSALVDMYGKCGNIEDSDRVFSELPEKNLTTWNAMIGGYSRQGHADMALALFKEMLRPDYVTFVCVLSACSRAGSVKIGLEIFEMMKSRYGIEPGSEHYTCVVDMLGRAGKIEQAYDFIKRMPIRPTIWVWGALLGACKIYGKQELGKIAAEKLFELDPKDSGNHVLLSNMFASAGRWEESNLVRKEMKEVGIKKGTGYSWISVKNSVHVFQSKDTSHVRNFEIQATLAKLRREMNAAGYTSNTTFALYDLEEEEKMDEVWFHSEKIALALGLISIPQRIPIRIIKNLRICGDCHSAFKFVSGIYDREIIVRDNNRFHIFKDYKCSCRDYW